MCQKTLHTHTFHDNYWSKLRVERNIGFKELSQKLNIPKGCLGNYFVGKVVPSDKVAAAICDYFNVPFEEGMQEFINGNAIYYPSRSNEDLRSNSEANPDFVESDSIENKVLKKHKKKVYAIVDKTNTRTIHETAWRQRFRENNITAAEFATYLGKEKSTVAKYLSGKSRPPKEITQMFADYFSIPYVQAAEEFQIAYEQYHNIVHKTPKKLFDIEDTSSIALPEVEIKMQPITKTLSKRATNSIMKALYGKVDADTFMMIVNKGKITESKLRELYLKLDYDTFIELSKFLKR